MTCSIFIVVSNERHLRLVEEKELDVVIVHARTEIVQVLGEETAPVRKHVSYSGDSAW